MTSKKRASIARKPKIDWLEYKVFKWTGRDAELIDVIQSDPNRSWTFERKKDKEGNPILELYFTRL